MSQDIVQKKAQPPMELTEMQKRFCEYLIFNEGRTTHQDAALHAGYSPQRARIEKDTEESKQTKNLFALDDDEVENIFDILEQEHPDL